MPFQGYFPDVPLGSIVTFSLAFLFTAVTCFPVRDLFLRWNVLDYANDRSSHTHPTVTSAGVTIVLAIALLGLWWSWRTESYVYLFLHAGIIGGACVSLRDDRNSLPIAMRLTC